MKRKHGKRKSTRRFIESLDSYSKIPRCREKLVQSPTKSFSNGTSPITNNYNDSVVQLIQNAEYLSPYAQSSYEEWARTQDQAAIDQAPSLAIEDVLKARIKLTKQKFVDSLNWKTLDVINYLISSHSEKLLPRSPEPSQCDNFEYLQRNPIVFKATVPNKNPKTGVDKSAPTGTAKSTRSYSQVSSEKIREPVYPKKYEPTYKLSNYDYVKKGWTKLPDYSITYRYYTLGAEPAFPALWAFRQRADGRKDFYPNSGQVAADFQSEKPYFVYHPNGEVAISINEGRAGPRLIAYSMSKKDSSGRWIESRPQAMFDSKGNGVVYDLEGRMKMNYDQIEGAMYSYGKNAKPVLHWYWKESTYLRMRREDLDGLPADQNDDIDPSRPDGDNRKSKSSKRSSKGRTNKSTPENQKKEPTKKEAKKGSKNKGAKKNKSPKTQKGKSEKARKSDSPDTSPAKRGRSRRYSRKGGGMSKRLTRIDIPPLRKKPTIPKPITELTPLAVKITDHISMRIMNQQHIHLDFECGIIHYRLYLGVNVNPAIVERIDKVVNPKKADNVTPCYFELMPLRSLSLYYVNKKVQDMKREAARREYKKNIRTVGGFYAWWLKKKRVGFENKANAQTQQLFMTVPSKKH